MRQLKTSKSDELWRKMKKCENGKAIQLKQRKRKYEKPKYHSKPGEIVE